LRFSSALVPRSVEQTATSKFFNYLNLVVSSLEAINNDFCKKKITPRKGNHVLSNKNKGKVLGT
jgi:hypothetical protein